MTTSLITPPITPPYPAAGHPHRAIAALQGYLAGVTTALGIGLESCTIDHDSPVCAYVALDERLAGHPDRDLALLWDEVHGWAAAIETHSGEDLIVVGYLGGDTVVPAPARVSRFVRGLRDTTRRPAVGQPPRIRTAGDLTDLDAVLRAAEQFVRKAS